MGGEAEKTLYLCDPYMDSSSEEPPDLFEFFSHPTSAELCAAEDLIFCGKLFTFQQHNPPIPLPNISPLLINDSKSKPPSNSSTSPSSVRSKVRRGPRWYMLMFGILKVQTEMELGDIKNRQFSRRSPSTLIPTDGRKGTSGLLRAFSCKDRASTAVGTSSSRMPESHI